MTPSKFDRLVSEFTELISWRLNGVHEEFISLHAEDNGLHKWSQNAQLRKEHSPSWSLPESAGDLLRRMGPGLFAELLWGVGDALEPAVAEGFPFMTRHSSGKRYRQLMRARGELRLSILSTSGIWNNHHKSKHLLAQDHKVVLIFYKNCGSGVGETFKSHLG